MTTERPRRKVRIGVVLSDKMTKTRVVGVEWTQPHPVYRRPVKRMTRFKAHDAEDGTRQGDRVRIIETRPLSKDKRWRIAEVLTRAQVVELKPEEVDQSLVQELEGRAEPVPAVAEPVEVEAPVVVEEPATSEDAAEEGEQQTQAQAPSQGAVEEEAPEPPALQEVEEPGRGEQEKAEGEKGQGA